MTYAELAQRIEQAGHGLCVGLDPDPSKLPAETDLATFCIGIIDATAHVAVAYKPNFAFFEALGRLDGGICGLYQSTIGQAVA